MKKKARGKGQKARGEGQKAKRQKAKGKGQKAKRQYVQTAKGKRQEANGKRQKHWFIDHFEEQNITHENANILHGITTRFPDCSISLPFI